MGKRKLEEPKDANPPVRCSWGGASAEMVRYHDEEWGATGRDPFQHSDNYLFEMLVLESAQAGLSWATILAKRQRYREVYDNFDVLAVARFDAQRKAALAQDAGIVRNRSKIESSINNAKCLVNLIRSRCEPSSSASSSSSSSISAQSSAAASLPSDSTSSAAELDQAGKNGRKKRKTKTTPNENRVDRDEQNNLDFHVNTSESTHFAEYIRGFLPDGQVVVRSPGQPLAARSEISDAISTDLKQRGFNFVGSTIMHAFLQAAGFVNEHDPTCFRHPNHGGLP